MNMEQARFNMIEQQIRPCSVLDDTVLQTMASIPRELFAPEALASLAYADIEVPCTTTHCSAANCVMAAPGSNNATYAPLSP